MIEFSTDIRVERQSLAAEVAEKLQQLIQAGVLPPGERLVEADLAKQLGVSRGPLREALRVLEMMALVETRPGRGSYVAALSKQDARELYSLRAILEQEAVRLACAHAEEAQIQSLEENLHQLLAAAEAEDVARVAELDLQFHSKVWEMSGHKRLQQMLDGLMVQIMRYRSLQTNLYKTLIVGINDHKIIYDGIRQRDCKQSITAVRKHLEIAANAAAASLHSAEDESE